MTLEPELFTRRVGIFSSIAMIIIGIIGIYGWITGNSLEFEISNLMPIAPAATIAYVLLGSIVLALIIPLKGKFAKLTVKFLITFIMAIACMFWITAIFFPSLDIEKFLEVALTGGDSSIENRIAPLAAFGIFLGTVALTRITYMRIKWRHYDNAMGLLGLIIFSIGFLSLIGYAFGTPQFYGTSIRAVSFSSSFALVFFGIGIIALNGTSKWPSSVFSSNTVSAQMIRFLVPITAIALLSFSWVLFRVIIPSSVDPVPAVAIFTAISIASVAYTVSFVSGRIQKIIEKAQNEKTRAIESLALANKKLDILDSLTRHDILNQASLASIEAELMKRMSKEPSIKESAERIENINKTIIRQLQFSKEYRKIGIEEPQWRNLRKLLSEVIDQLNFGKIGVENHCGGWRIYADLMIEKTFFNILENSLRHGGSVTKVLIECAASEKDDTLRIVLSDNGIGVPEDEKERIFEKGFGKNTGLGLFLTRQILSITGISIIENGIPGKGARFEISIPKDSFKQGEQSDPVQRERASSLKGR